MAFPAMSPPPGPGRAGAAGAQERAERRPEPSPRDPQIATKAPPRFAEGTGPVPTQPEARFVPHLALSTETLFVEDGSRRGDEVKVAAIRLDFDYQGSKVRSSDPLPRVYDMARIERGPIVRDQAGERQARRVLESLGAIELAMLDDCAVSPGAEVDYIVRLDGDVHALCAFSAYALPQLRQRGWKIDIDTEYPWQVVAGDAPLYADLESTDDRPDWFSLELGVEVDGHRVNLLPTLLEMLDGASDLENLTRPTRRCVAVRVDDKRWLPVPPARLKMLCKVLLEMYREGDKLVAPKAAVSTVAELGEALHDEVRPLRWTGDRRIRDQAYALALGPSREAVEPPPGLFAELRPYQLEGVAWLQHLREHDAGGILADDMGLGKTLQTITHILTEKVAGRLDRPAMVLTLTSLVGNWARELARFAPSLRVLTLHGPQRKTKFAEIDQHDVVITTYPLVSRDLEDLAPHPLHLLILDEAHAIKNSAAQAAEAVRGLTARHRVCLSGTPIENHLGELWSLMDFLMPGMLGTGEEFRSNFRHPIEDCGDQTRLQSLRDRVRPYILRRTKDSVAKELPPKTELVRAVEMTGAQRDLYESIRVAAHADVRQHIKDRGIGGATIAILDALLKLRQVCCDPRTANVEAARGVEGSAKLDLLLEMVTTQLAEGRRILVFSSFAKMLALISEALLARGIGHVTLTGQTADRQKPIDAFQNGRADVFLISLKAGGTGLNLTSADTVIHYDPWWNPAAQAQATDRAYWIG
jgi:superfamily II DNA or RNA helicase